MSIIGRVLENLAREIIYFLTKCKTNRILLMYEPSSGSNSYALLKFASNRITKKYEIISFQDSKPKTLIEYVKKHKLLASAKLIITTHGSYKPTNKNIHLQLWHGPFIKKTE